MPCLRDNGDAISALAPKEGFGVPRVISSARPETEARSRIPQGERCDVPGNDPDMAPRPARRRPLALGVGEQGCQLEDSGWILERVRDSRPGRGSCPPSAQCLVAGSVQGRLGSPQTAPASATLPPTPPPPTLLPNRFAHGGETLGDAQRLGNEQFVKT